MCFDGNKGGEVLHKSSESRPYEPNSESDGHPLSPHFGLSLCRKNLAPDRLAPVYRNDGKEGSAAAAEHCCADVQREGEHGASAAGAGADARRGED